MIAFKKWIKQAKYLNGKFWFDAKGIEEKIAKDKRLSEKVRLSKVVINKMQDD